MSLTHHLPLIDTGGRADDLIAFNRPAVVGRELHYVASTITNSNISGGGFYTQACQAYLEAELGTDHALLVTSCTAALEMAAMLCQLGPGDEVILPSFTFVSTAEAVVRTGATPVFVDVRPDTLNLDESLLTGAITSRTKAIWPIHYAGVGAEMDAIMAIATERNLLVVEDAAQALGAKYQDRPLGAIAPLGTFSFHETKNVSCGEGGALCINDPSLLERAEILRDKGTNRRQFQRGVADKYTWVDHGSSYVLSEMLAAFLYGQLEEYDTLATTRAARWDRYHGLLIPLAAEGLVELPRIPSNVEHNHHIFYLMTTSRDERDHLINHLAERGIQAVFHYVPLHSSPMGRKVGRTVGEMPNTDAAADRLLRLPLHHSLSEAEVENVADAVSEFYRSPSRSG